jgi:hypothetical protein
MSANERTKAYWAAMTPEERSEIARKREAKKTAEMRREIAKKGQAGLQRKRDAGLVPVSETERARRAEAMRARWADPVMRQQMLEKLKAARSFERRSADSKRGWREKTPAEKEARLAKIQSHHAARTPEERRRRGEERRAWWATRSAKQREEFRRNLRKERRAEKAALEIAERERERVRAAGVAMPVPSVTIEAPAPVSITAAEQEGLALLERWAEAGSWSPSPTEEQKAALARGEILVRSRRGG